MTDKLGNITNAKFLADSYKVSSREELAKIYDEWADLYDEHARIRNSAQPSTVAKIFLDVMKDQSIPVLDIGAGTGLIGEVLKEKGYSNLSALDASQNMLDIAKEKGVYQTYYKAYLGDILPLDDESFGAIVASGIFTTGHVDATAFPELNRILKDGGKMIFSINTKLLKDASFDEVIQNGKVLNWVCDQISPEFDMMKGEFSTAKAVIVVLSKTI